MPHRTARSDELQALREQQRQRGDVWKKRGKKWNVSKWHGKKSRGVYRPPVVTGVAADVNVLEYRCREREHCTVIIIRSII